MEREKRLDVSAEPLLLLLLDITRIPEYYPKKTQKMRKPGSLRKNTLLKVCLTDRPTTVGAREAYPSKNSDVSDINNQKKTPTNLVRLSFISFQKELSELCRASVYFCRLGNL